MRMRLRRIRRGSTDQTGCRGPLAEFRSQRPPIVIYQPLGPKAPIHRCATVIRSGHRYGRCLLVLPAAPADHSARLPTCALPPPRSEHCPKPRVRGRPPSAAAALLSMRARAWLTLGRPIPVAGVPSLRAARCPCSSGELVLSPRTRPVLPAARTSRPRSTLTLDIVLILRC